MKLKIAPATLNRVGEEQFSSMRPGDVILIDPGSNLRGLIESAFFAVLACPWCGMPALITYCQFVGEEPVMCGADSCSCRFRIKDNGKFQFLPAS